jgi:DNA polymerase-3 subunit beta
MGYTHYFYTHKHGIPESAWQKICADVRTLLANLPKKSLSAGGYHPDDSLVIQWEDDTPDKAPEVSDDLIRFNGNSELGHETFYFPRVPEGITGREESVFAFCKTARKPYDLVVCGALIVAAKHAPAYIKVTSDGDLEDWTPAFEWVASLLGSEFTAAQVAARLTEEFQLGGAPIAAPEPEPEQEPETQPVTTSYTFITDAKEFRTALELAVTEKKAHIPVLTHVALRPQGSILQVLSTDLDKWVVTDVPAIIDDEAETVLLPRKKSLELLKGETGFLKITATTVTLVDKFSRRWVKLEVGGVEYDISSPNPSNFPVFPEVTAVAFTAPGKELKEVIGRILPAVSREESRYTLNCASLISSKGTLLVVATDGHRLALDSLTVQKVKQGSKALVHNDALDWIYRHSAGDVTVSLGEELSSFRLVDARTTLISRNLKGNFPNYEKVIPRDHSTVATFPSATDLAKTLAKVVRMADERSGCVKFRVNDHVVLSAESSDTGKASATVPATINHSESDTDIMLGFNSSYIADALKVAGKNPVVLSLKDAKSAGVFTVPSVPGYKYVTMPMRV